MLARALATCGGHVAADAAGSLPSSDTPPDATTPSAIVAAAAAVKFDRSPLSASRWAGIVSRAQQNLVVEGGAAVHGVPSIAIETNGTTIVTWSLIAPGLDPSSSLSVVLGKNDKLIGSEQADFTQNQAGGGTIRAWADATPTQTTQVTSAQLAQAQATALGTYSASIVPVTCATAGAQLAVLILTLGVICLFSGPAPCVAFSAVVAAAFGATMAICNGAYP